MKNSKKCIDASSDHFSMMRFCNRDMLTLDCCSRQASWRRNLLRSLEVVGAKDSVSLEGSSLGPQGRLGARSIGPTGSSEIGRASPMGRVAMKEGGMVVRGPFSFNAANIISVFVVSVGVGGTATGVANHFSGHSYFAASFRSPPKAQLRSPGRHAIEEAYQVVCEGIFCMLDAEGLSSTGGRELRSSVHYNSHLGTDACETAKRLDISVPTYVSAAAAYVDMRRERQQNDKDKVCEYV